MNHCLANLRFSCSTFTITPCSCSISFLLCILDSGTSLGGSGHPKQQKCNIQVLESGPSPSGSGHPQLKKGNIQILDNGLSPGGLGHPQQQEITKQLR